MILQGKAGDLLAELEELEKQWSTLQPIEDFEEGEPLQSRLSKEARRDSVRASQLWLDKQVTLAEDDDRSSDESDWGEPEKKPEAKPRWTPTVISNDLEPE